MYRMVTVNEGKNIGNISTRQGVHGVFWVRGHQYPLYLGVAIVYLFVSIWYCCLKTMSHDKF